MAKLKETVVLQSAGMEADVEQIMKNVKQEWKKSGGKAGQLSKIDVYLKPEDRMAYFVINDGELSGSVPLFDSDLN